MNTVLVDFRISEIEKENLAKLGFEVLTVPPSKVLYEAVCGHPDMLLHKIDNNNVIVHKDMETNFIEKLKKHNLNIFHSANELQKSYPFNIILNAVNLSSLFIHNVKYTDSTLLQYVKDKKIKNVKQGYSKCSTAIVAEDAIMTNDKSIAGCASEEGIDVLLLSPGDILLPGINYGFIGGCCGLLEERLLGFYGSLEHYAFGKEVLNFLKKHSVEPVFLSNKKLIDRGTIFRI